MAVTLRNDAKQEIMNILRKQGYPTYAILVSYFDIYLTDDMNVIGYMIPDQAKIVLNMYLSINQVSTIVRHEILHEYLEHAKRAAEVAKRTGKVHNQKLANIAADYEISNKGYTSNDKAISRAIILQDKVLRGLVTEDDHPDWENLTFEEMYEILLKEQERDESKLQSLLDRIDSLNQQDMSDLKQDAQNSDSDNSADSNKQSQSTNKETDSTSDKASKQQSSGSKLDKEVDKIQSELDDIDVGGSDKPFPSDEEQKRLIDIAARAEKIRELLNDERTRNQLSSEASDVKTKEIQDKEARDLQKHRSSPLAQFRLNLTRYIADEVAEEDDFTYRRINPHYEDSEFMEPAYIHNADTMIPLINVYLDVSGSFSSEAKTAAAFKAIHLLNEYKRNGQIELKEYYFADIVSDTKSKAGGGTRGKPIQEHIKATRPNNVIIITDGDIGDCTSTVTVPGAVWMLFYDSRSENIISGVKGKKQNKYYDIVY